MLGKGGVSVLQTAIFIGWLGCFEDFSCATWKQEIPNLWNRSSKTRVLTPDPKSLTTAPPNSQIFIGMLHLDDT